MQREDRVDVCLMGRSPSLLRVQRLIGMVKDLGSPVFIWGESGTGKELVARSIHRLGSRHRQRFVALNCGAIPEHLVESELFGYARGAFTGALRDRAGLMEEASGGTLFLDEIADLSLPLQAKLLRVLEEKTIRRIGENHSRPVDVRFISATNRDLEKEVTAGRFREDLFYRLKILTIELTPLRERRGDILVLIEYFLEKFCREMNKPRVRISPAALEMMIHYPWPGNVRELQNELQHGLIMSEATGVITPEELSTRINPHSRSRRADTYDYFQAKAEFEKRFLHLALSRCNYNRAQTARTIGISRQGLFKLMKKHRINLPLKKERGSPDRYQDVTGLPARD